ncbi:GFA family protein [Albibacillus kandeliae]|uniref:GFA family protein n=1 Tax=Albibacillus kandeliae TaxID=2174228 RepID=UPI000D6856E2|nr:GFA family protein [Albibacillus kandeliae]
MPDIATLPATGGCQCGALRFSISAPPLFSAACHCRDCQKMTGGAFSLTVGIPKPAFEVTSGTPVRGGLGASAASTLNHMHCESCKSWVFTFFDDRDFLVNVRTSMLDVTPTEVPFMETMLSEGMPFARLGAPHQYDGFPPREVMPELIAEYAAARH